MSVANGQLGPLLDGNLSLSTIPVEPNHYTPQPTAHVQCLLLALYVTIRHYPSASEPLFFYSIATVSQDGYYSDNTTHTIHVTQRNSAQLKQLNTTCRSDPTMSLLYSSASQRGHTLAKHKSALQGAQVLEHFLHHSDLSEGFLHIALGYGGVFFL